MGVGFAGEADGVRGDVRLGAPGFGREGGKGEELRGPQPRVSEGRNKY